MTKVPLRAEDILNGLLAPREWVEQGKYSIIEK